MSSSSSTPSSRLTPLERRWAHTALDAMYPRGADPALPLGILDMDVDGFLDETARAWPTSSWFALRLAFVLIAFAPVLLLVAPRTLAGLPPARRAAVVERLGRSRVYLVRSLVVLAKAVGGLLYGGHPAVRRALLGRADDAVAPVVALSRTRPRSTVA